jgi:hypothetical protein
MAATIDGKAVVFNDRFFFDEGETVRVIMPERDFQLQIRADSNDPTPIGFVVENGEMVLRLSGMSTQNHERGGRADITIGHRPYVASYKATLLFSLDGVNRWEVGITVRDA